MHPRHVALSLIAAMREFARFDHVARLRRCFTYLACIHEAAYTNQHVCHAENCISNEWRELDVGEEGTELATIYLLRWFCDMRVTCS